MARPGRPDYRVPPALGSCGSSPRFGNRAIQERGVYFAVRRFLYRHRQLGRRAVALLDCVNVSLALADQLAKSLQAQAVLFAVFGEGHGSLFAFSERKSSGRNSDFG